MTKEIEKIRSELQDPELMSLADRIVQVIEEGKQALAISINEIIKTTYWKIGQYIVEFEQHIVTVEPCQIVKNSSRTWL